MSSSKKITPILLEKYMQGKCSTAEKIAVEDWYAGLDRQIEHPIEPVNHEDSILMNDMLRNISNRIDQESENYAPRPRINWTWLQKVAASLLVLSCLLGYSFLKNNNIQPTANMAGQEKILQTIKTQRFINDKPRIIAQTLPDGSIVWLRPGAMIDYPETFDEDLRQVSFEGEGFFEVTKDKSRPFIIQSGSMTIDVLGTSFNVRALAHEAIHEVSVVTGRVAVYNSDMAEKRQKVVLEPNEQAIFQKNTQQLISQRKIVLPKIEIYQPTTLYFEQTAVSEVIRQLEARFNVNINLSNASLGACQFSADFENQSFPMMIDILCRALESSYTIDEHTVTITGEPCN